MRWGILFSLVMGFVGLMGQSVLAEKNSKINNIKQPLDLLTGSKVWIEGNSSLRRYYLTVDNISAKSDLNTSGSVAKTLMDLILQRKGHYLVVTIPVINIKSGDPNMDQNAYEKLRAKKFPDIIFTLKNYVVKAYPGSLSTYALLLSGNLKIAGIEKDVVLEPTMVLGQGGIKIYGSQDIYQSDFGISPYSVAIVMKTDNKIIVHYMIALGMK